MNDELLTDGVVYLRAIEPEDLIFLHTIENDSTCWSVSSTNVPYSYYSMKQYIASTAHNIYEDCQLRLIAEDEKKNVIGVVDLIDFSARHSRAEVGIAILKSHRGRGYSSRMIKLLEQYAKKVLNLHQLYAYVSEKNKISKLLFLNIDYKQVGLLCDWVQYDGRYEDVLIFQKMLQKNSSKICGE